MGVCTLLSDFLLVYPYLDEKGFEGLLEAMKKARRLNNHVFSMLKARCPLEDKQACAIKQSGAPMHRVKFENTVSAFETLPQKGAWAYLNSNRVYVLGDFSAPFIFIMSTLCNTNLQLSLMMSESDNARELISFVWSKWILVRTK